MQIDIISKQEIYRRVNKFQNILKELDVSGAIILQNVDRFYFSGTIQNATLFIPMEGDPILFVYKGLERAKYESPLNNIIKVKSAINIKEIINEYGIKIKRLGMELDVVPVNIYLKYKKIFFDSEILDISEFIRKIRMIKSQYEIAQIKKASSILDLDFKSVRNILKPGITEIEVDAFLGYMARKNGHMGIMRMRGWNQEMIYAHVLSGVTGGMISFLDSPQGGDGTSPAMAQGAGFKEINYNEPIEIDHGVCINGYISDESRTFVIGKLPDKLKKAHDCSWELHRFLEENAKPGILCHELYHKAINIVKDWGLEEYFMGYSEGKVKFIGHGVGLEIDEYPIISPIFVNPLQEGMVMAFEPKFVFPDKGVVGLEDVYLVKDAGLERITLTEQKVFEI